MEREQVEARVRAIADTAEDPEVAHTLEDELYLDLLRAIATGECRNPRDAALAAIQAAHLDFPRWHA